MVDYNHARVRVRRSVRGLYPHAGKRLYQRSWSIKLRVCLLQQSSVFAKHAASSVQCADRSEQSVLLYYTMFCCFVAHATERLNICSEYTASA